MRRIVTICAVVGMVFAASAASANDIASSTMVFEGSLIDAGGGVYTGFINMTAGEYYVPGGPGAGISTGGGFDVYAKDDGCAYVQGYYGTGAWNCAGTDTCTIGYYAGSPNDAYPNPGGPWGSWYNPDCTDWNQYSLELTADHWYLRYSTWESPMSGIMHWSTLYAIESDLGTQDRPQTRPDGNPVSPLHGGHGGSAAHGGGAQAWDVDWGWGVEVIPLELAGFSVSVENISGDEYKVTLTPAPNEVWVDDDFDASTPGWGITHFDNIQDGIDAVAGSTVHVAAGTYGADLVTGKGAYITKDGLNLVGESPTTTIIDGAIGGVGSSGLYWPIGIHVQANNVTVRNFTVRGFTGDLENTGGYGVLFRDYAHDMPGEGYIFYDGCTVQDTVVRDCYSSIYALCFTHLTVTGCAVWDSLADGMFIARGCDDAVVDGNAVSNSGDHGIWVGICWMGLEPSDRATITNNDVNGAQEGGISFVASNTATISGNMITNVAGESPPAGWSVGALSLKDGPSNVEAYNNTIFGNNGSWNGYAGTGNGVGIDGSASNINLHDNSIYGNTGHGCYNYSAAMVIAENNWWGAAEGPLDSAGTYEVGPGDCGSDPDVMLNVAPPGVLGNAVSGKVDYCPWLDTEPVSNVLKLNVQGDPVYLQHGDTVVLYMDVEDLAQKVNGCQAFLNYSSAYFRTDNVIIEKGGGVWDELIWSQVNTPGPGDLDVAVGVKLGSVVGTQADGTVAIFTLTVKDGASDGTTQMVFRPDRLNDPPGENDTMLSDLNAQGIAPTTFNSQTMVIDNTNPAVDDITLMAEPGGTTDLTPSGTAVQGDYKVSVYVSDDDTTVDSGIDWSVLPTITVKDSLGNDLTYDPSGVQEDSGNGRFTLVVKVKSTTANYTAHISVSGVKDKAGNENEAAAALANDTFEINKNQVTGTVSMATLLSTTAYEFNRVVVFKATNSSTPPVVLKPWTVSVHFVNNPGTQVASGSYTLTDVPDATANLSAKTAWSLRQRQAVAMTDGQAVNDFTLLGGDLNDSNFINILDYSILATNYGPASAPVADINGNGPVNISDYNILAANYFKSGDEE